jgi:hypothetical protein
MAEADPKTKEIDDSRTCATISGVEVPSAVVIQFTVRGPRPSCDGVCRGPPGGKWPLGWHGGEIA